MVETNTQYIGRHRPKGRIFGVWEHFTRDQIGVEKLRMREFLKTWDGINSHGRQQTGGPR